MANRLAPSHAKQQSGAFWGVGRLELGYPTQRLDGGTEMIVASTTCRVGGRMMGGEAAFHIVKRTPTPRAGSRPGYVGNGIVWRGPERSRHKRQHAGRIEEEDSARCWMAKTIGCRPRMDDGNRD